MLLICLVRWYVSPSQVSELSPDQLLLSLGLRSIMRDRGLDPQQDASLKQALPPFLRHASVVRVGKAQVRAGRKRKKASGLLDAKVSPGGNSGGVLLYIYSSNALYPFPLGLQ